MRTRVWSVLAVVVGLMGLLWVVQQLRARSAEPAVAGGRGAAGLRPALADRAAAAEGELVLRVHGRVVTRDGQPVDQGRVCLSAFGGFTAPTCEPLASGAGFVFEFRGEAGEPAGAVFRLGARGPDWVALPVRVDAADAVDVGPVVLVAAAATTAEFLVLDATGGAIEQARIDCGGGAVETDADGRAAVTVARQGHGACDVGAGGYARSKVDLPQDARLTTVRLYPGGEIRGTVLGLDGQPLAAAQVSSTQIASEAIAWTDERGDFALVGLPPGNHGLEAVAAGMLGVADRVVSLGVGEEVDGIVIRLAPEPASWTVRAVTGAGEPCRAGSVLVAANASADVFTINHRGEARIVVREATPAVELTVSCTAPPLPDTAAGPRDPGEVIAQGGVWEVLVPEARRIEGQLVGAPEALLSGVRLSVVRRTAGPHGDETVKLPDITSGVDGRFVISPVADGRYVVSSSRFDGAGPRVKPTELEVAGRDLLDAEVAVEDAAGVEGDVVDTEGHPIAHAWVGLFPLDDRGGQGESANAAGEFGPLSLAPGRYRVAASDDRGALPPAGGTDPIVEVQSGRIERVRLVVQPLDAVVRGVVVTGEGEPVADALVWVISGTPPRECERPRNLSRIAARTAVDGSFELRQGPRGPATVVAASVRDSTLACGGLDAPGELELVMPAACAVEVRIQGAPNDPARWPADLYVDAEQPSSRVHARFRSPGPWTVEGVPCADGTARVLWADGSSARSAYAARPGGVTRVELTIEPPTLVRGRIVRGSDATPVPGASVAVQGASARSGPDGAFELRTPKGAESVAVWPPSELDLQRQLVDLPATLDPIHDLGDIALAPPATPRPP